MKKWDTYIITNTFDNSVVEISWDGIKLQDAKNEVKYLVREKNRNIKEFIVNKK